MGYNSLVRRLASGLILWLASTVAYATCSGSGLTWSCTAGSTASQINTAISSASNGATITLDSGTYSATGIDLSPRNGITLICASSRACTMTGSGTVFSLTPISSTKTNLIRISGFKFTGTGSGKIWVYGNNNVEQLRIDNNEFNNIGANEIAIFAGENTSTGYIWGVIDGNLFTGTQSFMGVKSLHGNTGGRTDPSWPTGLRGTGQNLFFENNTFTFTNFNDLGTGGVDAWKSGGFVTRYNTFTNTRIVHHSYCHGGPANAELYGNTVDAPNSAAPGYRNLHHQGSGEITIFDNVLHAYNYDGYIAIQHFRADSSLATTEGSCSSTCNGSYGATGFEGADGNRSGHFGYPCWHQPGRDGAGTLKPVYAWNNRTETGARVPISVDIGNPGGACANTDNDRIDCHFRADRDYFDAVSATAQTSATSPFNGTTGMGFGTLARRPTTCSRGGTMSEDGSAGGVGYWATDVQTLYRCSATNTWTVDYRPYVYPHPLVSGKPAPPLNPRTK